MASVSNRRRRSKSTPGPSHHLSNLAPLDQNDPLLLPQLLTMLRYIDSELALETLNSDNNTAARRSKLMFASAYLSLSWMLMGKMDEMLGLTEACLSIPLGNPLNLDDDSAAPSIEIPHRTRPGASPDQVIGESNKYKRDMSS